MQQGFTWTKNIPTEIDSIRPYLYVHNNPSGTFKFELIRGSTVIATATFTSSDLYTAMATTDLYAHLFYKLDFDKDFVLEKGDYILKFSSTGYNFDNNSFIGWVQMHDDPINDYTYTPYSDNRLPLTFEIYEKRFMP